MSHWLPGRKVIHESLSFASASVALHDAFTPAGFAPQFVAHDMGNLYVHYNRPQCGVLNIEEEKRSKTPSKRR